MTHQTMLVLSIEESGGIPSVEVCESIAEVMKSVRWQLGESKATPDMMKQAERALTTAHKWTDSDGTVYCVRQRGAGSWKKS